MKEYQKLHLKKNDLKGVVKHRFTLPKKLPSYSQY